MNILEKANKITSKDRQQEYGPPKENFVRAAHIFNAIRLRPRAEQLTSKDIVYALIAVKLAREQYKHKRDNLVDLAGYSWVLNEVLK